MANYVGEHFEELRDQLLGTLKNLNTDTKTVQLVQAITHEYEKKLGMEPRLYEEQPAYEKIKKQLRNALLDRVKSGNKAVFDLIDVEDRSPYSIFEPLFSGSYSDLVFSKNRVSLSNGRDADVLEIPDYLNPLYKHFFNHMVKNITYVSETKFDASHAILDANLNGVRFNLIHHSINPMDNFPVMIARRQAIKKTDEGTSALALDEAYLQSIEVSEEQKDFINQLAEDGTFLIFGTTGSGKTTLLKYMGNHKLEDKRNLITIEDTAELFIPCDIAMVTNLQYGIHELFVATLRQNPSHCLIGETRTDEIVDILEAALTFRVGTTIHADSFNRAIERITFMSLKRQSNKQNILDLISAVVDGFIFMDHRKVKGVWRRNDKLHSQDIYELYDEVL